MQLRLGDICLLFRDQSCCPAGCAEKKQCVDSDRSLLEKAYRHTMIFPSRSEGSSDIAASVRSWELEIKDGCRALLIGQSPAIGSRSQEREQQ
jgi:hypothetical protein